MLKSKIHRATVTDANLDYVGSCTIDLDMIEAAGLFVHEQIHIANITNGARLVTYVIAGERGSRTMCLNGAAARLGEVGDKVIILAYANVDIQEAATFKAKIVHVDAGNKITHVSS